MSLIAPRAFLVGFVLASSWPAVDNAPRRSRRSMQASSRARVDPEISDLERQRDSNVNPS